MFGFINKKKLKQEIELLKDKNQQLEKEIETALNEKQEYLKKRDELIPKYRAAMKELDDAIRLMRPRPELLQCFSCNFNIQAYLDGIKNAILQHAFDTPPKIKKINFNIEAKIHSSSTDEIYTTTLSSCTCSYNQKKHKICKHSLYLAYLIGLLQIAQKDTAYSVRILSENYSQITQQKKELSYHLEKINIQKQRYKAFTKEIEALEERMRTLDDEVEEIINGAIAEAGRITLTAEEEANQLKNKK